MIRNLYSVFAVTALSAALSLPGVDRSLADEWRDDFDPAGRELASSGQSEYFVLVPGFRTVLESPNEKITITVLDETKVINGITTRVVEERELKNGELREISRNFFALDRKTGDVLYFGEDVDIYEKGKVKSHSGAWTAYEKGNRPGLIVPGNARVGMKYYQEIAPGVAMDRAEVVSVSETVKTPAGEFRNCLKTRETSKIEQAPTEYKMYAPGIGLVQKEDAKLTRYGYAREKSAKSDTSGAVSYQEVAAGVRLAATGNPPPTSISREKATEIALKKLPGRVTSVSVERKLGKDVYVVEIIEEGSGGEVDVLVDMQTGEVLGTER